MRLENMCALITASTCSANSRMHAGSRYIIMLVCTHASIADSRIVLHYSTPLLTGLLSFNPILFCFYTFTPQENADSANMQIFNNVSFTLLCAFITRSWSSAITVFQSSEQLWIKCFSSVYGVRIFSIHSIHV